MNDFPADHAPVLRRLLTAIVVVDLLSFAYFIESARDAALAAGTLSPLAAWLSHRVLTLPVAGAGTVAALGFGRAPGRLWHGLGALLGLAVLSTVHAQVFGSPWRHLFYSGLCLAGWLLGLLVTRRRGRPTDESYARVGSLALLSAAYFSAGISKMVFTGPEWLSGVPIQAVVVSQDGLIADGWLNWYRTWAVTTPAVAMLFSIATVGFELAAPLMLFGRLPRAVVALGLLSMHANILAMTHILYWESMLLLVAFGLCGPSPSLADDGSAAPPRSAGPPAFALAVALLCCAAALAVAHQARRFARVEAARALPAAPAAAVVAPASAPAPPAPPPTVHALRQVGPFSVGQSVAPGWSVTAVDVSSDGITTTLAGDAGRVEFEITCAESAYHSPYDLPAAHIFYTSEVPVSALDPPGQALRELIERAGGATLCARLTAWRAAALAERG